MGMYEDYVGFLDGGALVPYFVDNAKYCFKPTIYSERFEYDFKIYYKSYNEHFVGIHSSDFVRPILPSDYKMVKERALSEKRLLNKAKKVQLCFEF